LRPLLHSADLDATRKFFGAAFGWQPQPFASPEYLVAPHGKGCYITDPTGLIVGPHAYGDQAARNGEPMGAWQI